MSISEIKQKNPPAEKDITLYLSDFWRGFVKFWWVSAVLGVLFGAVMFYGSYVRYTPIYKSSATFTVHIENETLSGDGGMSAYSFYYDRTTADQLAIVFPYVLQSNILQERVCKDLNVAEMPATVSVSCVDGTNMITIHTVGTDPQMTYDVLLSVVDNYSYITEYIIGPTQLVTISSPEVAAEPANALDWQGKTLKGVLTGLCVGAVWIVLYAILRQTVRTKEDIQQELNQTCIGVLPQVTFKRYKKQINTSILLSNPLLGNDFLESMRLLRSAVQNGLREGEKIVLVTSTAPGEGKSVTAINLASMLAKNGDRILVMDGDLRSSGISGMLFPNRKPPQADGETEKALYDIIPYKPLGVDVLIFRTEQNSLRKIMRTSGLREILSELREQYDLILIDTPPCGIISDAAVMANAADAALYVVRQDTVLSTRIREGINSLLSTDVRLMGCILNGALGGLGGYGNHYGYGGYNHYYRYGYSSKYKPKKESKR